MMSDFFKIGGVNDSCVYKNNKWFFASFSPIFKLVVTGSEFYAFSKSKKRQGVWITCFDQVGTEKWTLIDCSTDPSIFDAEIYKRIEYQTIPPPLTVRPFMHGICYEQSEIYRTGAVIEWVLFNDGQIYVLTNEYKTCRNIHCIDTTGKYLWTIEPFEGHDGYSPYTAILYENDGIWAYASAGYDRLVEPKSGKILQAIFNRWGI